MFVSTREHNLSNTHPHPSTDCVPRDLTPDELCQHRGRWVAISSDGLLIIGSSPALATLDARVRAAGENPEEVFLEHVPDTEYVSFGAELT